MDDKAFTRLLRHASQLIDPRYFELQQYGQPAIFRERVYCYELYHQLRLAGENNDLGAPLSKSPLVLNGELDKSGHHMFQDDNLYRLKPDFLLHVPGDWARNHTAMEVKAANYHKAGLEKDLETLHWLFKLANYKRLILLVFGDVADCGALLGQIRACRQKSKWNSPLEIWHHASPGSEATPIEILPE